MVVSALDEGGDLCSPWFKNFYEVTSTIGKNIFVNDQGGSTKRFEQGMGATTTLNCGSGQAVKSITVKEGVVTGVNCGAP